MKKVLALAVIILAAFLLLAGRSNRLVILHVNDTHSHFEPIRAGSDSLRGGVIERAAYIDSVRSAAGEENVLLVHAGDFSQGTSYFTQLHGDLEIDVINDMRYDVITLGNHEFDNGPEELARRLAKLNCPVVCANYDFSSFEMGKYVKPYVILEKGGKKIGVFGMLTNILKVVDRSVSDRLPKFDDVEVATKWADYLKNEEKCDLVIALTHMGYDISDFDDIDLVQATRNIDLVIGGHSHTFLEKMEYAKNLDGKLLSGSSAVYKGVADGEYAVGLTFEEGGAKYVADGAPVKLVYMKEGVISKPDGIYIIKNAKHMENAKKFIDFITSKKAQTLITQQLHRRSVRDDVDAPVGLLPKAEIKSITDNEEVVNKNKKAWLDKFKDIFTSVQ